MNNQDLEARVKELLLNTNLFDLIEQTLAFEKEYKTSEFYKKTKMPIIEVMKYSKVFYALNIELLISHFQKVINELDLSQFNNVLDQLGGVFETENSEILQTIQSFKELKDELE